MSKMHDMISGTYGDNKLSKKLELNSSMSINNASQDELTQKLRGGISNNG